VHSSYTIARNLSYRIIKVPQDKSVLIFCSLQSLGTGRLKTGGDNMAAKDRSTNKGDKTKGAEVSAKDQKDQKKNMPCKNSVPT